MRWYSIDNDWAFYLCWLWRHWRNHRPNLLKPRTATRTKQSLAIEVTKRKRDLDHRQTQIRNRCFFVLEIKNSIRTQLKSCLFLFRLSFHAMTQRSQRHKELRRKRAFARSARDALPFTMPSAGRKSKKSKNPGSLKKIKAIPTICLFSIKIS